MSDKDAPLQEEQIYQQELPGQGFEANLTLPSMPLKDIIDDIAPSGVKVSAESLIGETFTLVRAKTFLSRFSGQHHCYYVVGCDEKTGELFNTVLGGSAVVDVLDALTRAKRSEPISVTLNWVKGGQYKGYYTLE